MAVLETLIAWFALSLTGALAPGPLSAAVVMQTNRHGRLHGILPMVGHAIVEIGIVAAIVLGVQALTLTTPAISLILGFGGIVIVLFGLLALREYRIDEPSKDGGELSETSATTVLGATAQGAAVSLLSPYFLLWWFAVGLSSVTMLVAELQVGVGTVLLAGILIYLTHVSTDFLFGAVLTMSTDKASEKTKAGGINWISMVIGLFQVILGAWFLLQALQIWLGTA
ncbi:hypothetical protein EU538_12335 [Candidatus Thorarchaeota archaeon]|nr:MAG: hypothetical protein EU538_12335 [Candidatus Thorarchaeota archaeon]